MQVPTAAISTTTAKRLATGKAKTQPGTTEKNKSEKNRWP